jgi:hypothetical protein
VRSFYRGLKIHTLHVLSALKLDTSQNELPFLLIGDEAFALQTDFLKPFNQEQLTTECRIVSCRLSGAQLLIKKVYEAFAVHCDFLKPFNQGHLTTKCVLVNYRLSRAQWVIKNVFGIMANRSRIFIIVQPPSTDIIVMVHCVLHNFLCRKQTENHTPVGCLSFEDYGIVEFSM